MKLFIDPGRPEGAIRAKPAVAEGADGCVGRRPQLLPATHPDVKPRVITKFEPWMALSFSEGSIGGDIERVNLRELEAFYGEQKPPSRSDRRALGATARRSTSSAGLAEPTGSNGIAIAGANTARARRSC